MVTTSALGEKGKELNQVAKEDEKVKSFFSCQLQS